MINNKNIFFGLSVGAVLLLFSDKIISASKEVVVKPISFTINGNFGQILIGIFTGLKFITKFEITNNSDIDIPFVYLKGEALYENAKLFDINIVPNEKSILPKKETIILTSENKANGLFSLIQGIIKNINDKNLPLFVTYKGLLYCGGALKFNLNGKVGIKLINE